MKKMRRTNEQMAVCEWALLIIFALAFIGYLVCAVCAGW
jgi:hypothetical protein